MTLAPNQIHHGDCIDSLSKMQPGSVDLCFADPPFNIGYSYDVYDDQQQAADYLEFCRGWISGVHRVLRDDGTFWLAIGDEYAAELKLMSQELGFHCRSWVIWYYTFGVNCVRGFSRSHTHLFHFVKDPKRFTFNGDNPTVRVPSARQLVYADVRANAKGRLPDNTWILRPQDIPGIGFSPSHDTWYYARVAGTFKEREGFHGCQMPEQLLGRIIRVSSDPGDLVLDPFGGSGTTLVVAKKLGRQFIGVELSEDYVRRVGERLGGCNPGDALDGPVDPVRSAPETSKGKKRTEFRGGRPVIPLDANIKRVIQSAFRDSAQRLAKTPQWVSAEEVLFDPQRSERFVAACKSEKILGDARTWQEFMLELSEEAELIDEGDHPKPKLASILPHCDDAEVAFQMMSVDYAMDLETLLCSPDAADEFDRTAALFAGQSDPPSFRSSIWHLRRIATSGKITRGAKQKAQDFFDQALPDAIPIDEWIEQHGGENVSGVYLVSDSAAPLFVGQSKEISLRLKHLRESEGWRKFDLQSVQVWPIDKVTDALIVRCLLITLYRPWLNASFMHQPVATPLF